MIILCLQVSFNLPMHNFVLILSTAHYKKLICGKGAQFKAKLLQLKPIHIFARAILLMKKLEMEKTKSTSVLKIEY